MPTENWYPISGATHDLPYDAWTLGAGANKNVSCRPGGGRPGPVTHDDDTTYVAATGAQRQAFNIDWPGPVVAFISMNGNHRSRESSVAAQSLSQEWSNAGGTLSGTYNTSDPAGTYTDVGPADVAALRPGGGSWVPADFADDKTMFATIVTNAANVRTTSVWGALDYTPPAGGFAFLLQLAGLAALPIVGRLADLGQFRAYLSWRRRFHPRHTILTGPEVEQAWREIRAYRHPVFFLPRFA